MKEKKDSGIFHAVDLALLEKSREEKIHLSNEVEKILAFVSDVQTINTEEEADSIDRINIFRDDTVIVEAGIYRDRMLAQAPNTFKQWFLSKKIL